MTPATLSTISLALGLLGFCCFAWPILTRLTRRAPAEAADSGNALRSPLWWAGLLLTAAAVFIQRLASQQAG